MAEAWSQPPGMTPAEALSEYGVAVVPGVLSGHRLVAAQDGVL